MPTNFFGKRPYRILALGFSLALGMGLTLLSLSLPATGLAQGGGEIIGLASEPLACLVVGDSAAGQPAGMVNLTWQGQAQRARLILDVAGNEALHHVKINGRVVADVPIQPGGQVCGSGEVFYLTVPLDVLVQGDNLVELTDDAQAGDSWSAANVRLEVIGQITRIPVPSGGPSAADVSATATINTVNFQSSYDGSMQQVRVQKPTNYDSLIKTPLLIAVHPRSGTMYFGEDTFGAAADAKNWLLASPELHGRWDVPPECYVYPNSCSYEDKVVAGTTSASAEPKPGAYAYASLESQYDIIDTIKYVLQNYPKVDPQRIYIVGYSMGGQGTLVTAAKYPHLFAAVFANKPPTDMVTWYDEQEAYYLANSGTSNVDAVRAMRKECYVGTNTPAYPGPPNSPTNPFCYQRRSGLYFAPNFSHVPISFTHSTADALVPVHHSGDMVTAINYFASNPTSLFEDTVVGPTCPPHYHCYEPDPTAVLNFLEQHTLNNNPTSITISSDQSKSFYWLNLVQTGGEHWTGVQASYNQAARTVTAVISDTQPLTVAFNLGSIPIDDVIPVPGMGFPAGFYDVSGGGNNFTTLYSSGYLTVTANITGQYTLNISPSAVTLDYKVRLPLILKSTN